MLVLKTKYAIYATYLPNVMWLLKLGLCGPFKFTSSMILGYLK